MNIIDIIDKKRKKEELTDEEIKYLVNNFVNGSIKDYQMSSLLMAITINDMTDNEVYSLTKYMLDSGNKIDLSMFEHVCDKHSTGGVGDKITMIIAPIVSSCGVCVAKMSGRGLGYTGGTIDKLESIPGFNVKLTSEEFIKEIKDIGMSVVSQTDNLVIADKKIYALRDVTGTVESIPLIASSIMSKKIASGANKLVIDVKVGKGALIKNKKDAEKLAKLMIQIGHSNKLEVICLLTNMDIPLGTNIGNALEVKEAMDILKNQKQGNLTNLCVELSSYMVSLGLEISYEEAKKKVLESLKNGKAYQKFIEFIHYQKGDLTKLPKSKFSYSIQSKKEGYLTDIDALSLGKLSMYLGAGRLSLNDELDYGAGIIINKQIGEYIDKDDVLMTLYTNKELDPKEVSTEAFSIQKEKPKSVDLIYKVMK